MAQIANLERLAIDSMVGARTGVICHLRMNGGNVGRLLRTQDHVSSPSKCRSPIRSE